VPSRYIPIAGGVVYHVTNRARPGLMLFDSARAFCVMPIESGELRQIRECLKTEPLRRRPASNGRFEW
jgi:hypothetical protein